MAKAIASGRATIPTMTPAWRSARNWVRVYPSCRIEKLRFEQALLARSGRHPSV
jgi:hypothetical protein